MLDDFVLSTLDDLRMAREYRAMYEASIVDFNEYRDWIVPEFIKYSLNIED